MSAELGAVITNPKYGYAQLDTYNYKSVWGPPVSPIVPPMQYIQLPHDYNNYGYNALSHDYDGVGYYNVETGYGKRCTSFHMAQSPNNEPIRPPAPPMLSTPPPMMKEAFTMEKKKPLKATIENLQLVAFVDTKNCPHCQSFINLLQQEDLVDCVMIKDISNPSFRNEMAQHGANGVPFIKSAKLGTSITGSPPNIEALVKALDKSSAVSSTTASGPQISPELARQLKDLDITVYTSDSCHFCVMYKAFIEKAGLRPYVKIVDLTNKNDVVADPYLQTNQLPAIPFTYSKTLRTSFPGLPRSANKGSNADSIQEIITLLTTQSP